MPPQAPQEAAFRPLPREASPGASTLFLHPERIELSNGDEVTVERGMLFVPIVRADPDSATIGIEVYRFRGTTEAARKAPPVFQLHGGPGWPGLDPDQIATDYQNGIRPMVEMADVVIVGQRGIGTSKPNTLCAGVSAAERTPEEEERALRQACTDCRAYWEAQGYDLSGFNVIEAAADVDDVRRLLGYSKITVWGGSYGSHWGMAVLRYHPDVVARAILHGMEGPDHTYDMPSGVLGALERIAIEASASTTLADEIPEEGLVEALRAIIADVEEEPIEVEVSGRVVTIEADDLREAALGYTGRVNSRSGASTWPADVIALTRGDFERLAQTKVRRGGPSPVNLPTASFFMLDCGSGISPARLERLNTDPAAQVVGDLGAFYKTACEQWDADLGEEFRAGFTTQIPTVIVHGTWDVSTPFDNAVELLPSFPNARFVVVEGGTHGALNEAMNHSKDFRDAVMAFAATGELDGIPERIDLPPVRFAPPR